jgi:formylglycine-generating enzyme required for sulfatase activity
MVDDPVPPLARIPRGEFTMGADDTDEDERPAHRVQLDEYYLGIHPVTNAEYERFVRESGHSAPNLRALPLIVRQDQQDFFQERAAPFVWTNGTPPEGRARHPVTLVSIEDAMAYCEWLQSRAGRPFRLPTEAEWEKAARGGLEHERFPWGDDIDPSYANYLADSEAGEPHGTTEVGTYPANGYELFDMAGNVWQWVSDWYAPDYYARPQHVNPSGPEAGRMRIVRGGSWVNDDIKFLRCSYRHKVPVDSYSYSVGFRIACSLR